MTLRQHIRPGWTPPEVPEGFDQLCAFEYDDGGIELDFVNHQRTAEQWEQAGFCFMALWWTAVQSTLVAAASLFVYWICRQLPLSDEVPIAQILSAYGSCIVALLGYRNVRAALGGQPPPAS